MIQTKLQLNGSVHVAADADVLYDNLAYALLHAASDAVEDRGVFHLALSGGSTPQPFYQRLVTDPCFRPIPWQRTHVWLVDERLVGEDDDRSNYKMIRQTLLEHVPTPAHALHPMPVTSQHPAEAYESEMREIFGIEPSEPESSSVPRLDFVILGVGGDGHTASLFPGSPAQGEKARWIAINTGPTVTPPDRLTMTYPLLNASQQLAVLVTGQSKQDMLRAVDQQLVQSGPDPARLPITGICPQDGGLTWYLDSAACGRSDHTV